MTVQSDHIIARLSDWIAKSKVNAKSVAKAHAERVAKLQARVRELELNLVDAAAVSEREADGLRAGADVLVAENARLVAEVERLKGLVEAAQAPR